MKSLLPHETARDNLAGMALVFGSTILFATMHASIKHVSTEIHPFQVAFFRNFFGLLVLCPVFLRYGMAPLRTARPGLMMARAAINTVAMITFFLALSMSPLADVAALSFTAPIFATMLAIFVLGEVVRVKRWIAILAGLGGALLILRPGLGVLETGHLLTLFSAACWAIALTIIKVMARTESALTITIYMVLLMTPLSLGPALFYWTWPTWTELGWMALIGAVGTLAQLALTEGLKRGDTNVVMPLDFFKLVWAALIGFVLFAEVPDAFTWAGGAVIFVAATYIALRERALKKDTTPTPRTPAQS